MGTCLVAAQQAPTPLVIRTQTQAVQINVSVHDKQGEPVRSLQREDFTVLDDGKAREIQFFSEDAVGAPISKAAPPQRLTAIVLDGLNTEFEDQNYARDQALKALARIPLDQPVAVLLLDKKVELQNFTSNREKLLAAIRDFRPNLPPYGMKKRIEVTLGALKAPARQMSVASGRKSIVWVTGGFMQVHAYQETIERALDRINDTNTALYPVDARGLMLGNGASMNIQSLQQFADSTGGAAYYNGNNLAGEIEQAVEDARTGYVMGFYQGDDDQDGRYHELKVKLNRHGALLHYRRGYTAAYTNGN